jgi:hypothetical protein
MENKAVPVVPKWVQIKEAVVLVGHPVEETSSY